MRVCWGRYRTLAQRGGKGGSCRKDFRDSSTSICSKSATFVFMLGFRGFDLTRPCELLVALDPPQYMNCPTVLVSVTLRHCLCFHVISAKITHLRYDIQKRSFNIRVLNGINTIFICHRLKVR